MGKTKRPRPLKTILMTYFMGSVFLFCCILGLLAVVVVQSVIRENMITHYTEVARHTGKNLSRELEDIADIADYMFVNNDVKNIIENYDLKNYRYIHSVDLLDNLLLQNIMSNVYSNLNAMVVFSHSGIVYRYGGDSSVGRDVTFEELYHSAEYQQAVDENRMVLASRTFGAASSPEKEQLVVVRTVMDRHYSRVIGGFVLMFDKDIVENALINYEAGSNFASFLVGEDGKVLQGPEETLPEALATHFAELQPGENTGEMTRVAAGRDILLFYPIPAQRCCAIFRLTPAVPLEEYGQILAVLALALGTGLLVSLILWRSMNRRVVAPIREIRQSIETAHDGARRPIVTEQGEVEEISLLVESYNQNVNYIEELADRLSEEKTRYKDLEYKALQSQINSHFITNTLNAIRWMAIMQKALNIKDVIDAFSRLLKSTWQGMAHDTTIGKELSNVRDYIFIQQITHSYNCELVYDVAPELLDKSCAKFILQPLVENAFFHGIAPKGGVGVIRIDIHPAPKNNILIQVLDNGVGMDEATRNAILYTAAENRHFNGIGISNIHQRLQMKHGPEYGVSIESEPGEYTRISVLIPDQDPAEE